MMSTISEIKDRVGTVVFGGWSVVRGRRARTPRRLRGLRPERGSRDVADLRDRIEDLRGGIILAAAELLDVAEGIARDYAANEDEVVEIRLLIGETVNELVNVAQGAVITPEEAGE